jgi:HD-GYP domain-containing protein (c-di-GMP phosphodiesterase class II)
MADTNAAPKPAEGSPLDINHALDLFSIAGSLNSTLDLDFLLQKIGMAAERLLDSEASAIMLVTEDKKSLYFRVASGEKAKALRTMVLPIGQGIGGWVAQNRKPQVVNDAQKDPRFAGKFDKASGFVTRSLLCVPMIFRGELVGVVEVLNKRAGSYTEEHIGLLSSLASLASVAITNTKIISEQKNFFSHIMELLVDVIETTKPNMEEHPVRASKLACAIGRGLGVDEYEYRMLYYAGILHDIGYVGFKNLRLLGEVGAMSAGEELHPTLGAKMLDGIKMIEGAIPMIRHHHERFDGTGYPGKLKGEDIPLGARILGLVEAVEEVRMMGLRGDELHGLALKEAKDGAGTRFDPKVVAAFTQVLQENAEVWL